MLYRAFLLLFTSFFLAMDGTMAQSPPQFIVPNANIRAKLDRTDPSNIKLTHTIVHGDLGAIYEIKINYYASGCQGSPVTNFAPTGQLDTSVLSTPENGFYNSVIVNELKAIRANTGTGGTTPEFFTIGTTTSTYKYCIEFVLKSIQSAGGAIHDQVRYDVKLTGGVDGGVSTDSTVITDIDSSGGTTTFTARVYVCVTDIPSSTTISYEAFNSNFFEGDVISFCFVSNNFPEASITDLSEFKLEFGTPTASIDVKPSNLAADAGRFVTEYRATATCVSGTGPGIQQCKVRVPLSGPAAGTLFPTVTDPANLEKTIIAKGLLAMKFGTRRRNVRVLFQSDEPFQRNANTTFVVSRATEDDSCECGGFFFLICMIMCFISSLFG